MKKVLLLTVVCAIGITFWYKTNNVPVKSKLTFNKPIDVLLLTALPASGKSEVRKYLSNLSPEECRNNFGIGETVQIDDFPYVHIMRRVSDELSSRGIEPPFFPSPAMSFKDSRDWGMLIKLVNEDYSDLVNKNKPNPSSAAMWLFNRMDKARMQVGAEPVFRDMDASLKKELLVALEKDAKKLLKNKINEIPDTLEGKTVVIEFARGGADSSPMPLPSPYGYKYSFAQLSPEILEKASVLYIWVSPEESRKKNEARANPNDPGSILNHCVPRAVMYNDYGCDDIEHLIESSDKPDTIKVNAYGKEYYLPIGRFDNRVDKTTFVHDDKWAQSDINALQSSLEEAFSAFN